MRPGHASTTPGAAPGAGGGGGGTGGSGGGAPVLPPGAESRTLKCSRCETWIGYSPLGSPLVQCSVCQTINQGEQVVKCGRCSQLLLYNPLGSPLVQCALCLHVTKVPERFFCPQCNTILEAREGTSEMRCTHCGTTLRRQGAAAPATTSGSGGRANPLRTTPPDAPTDDVPAAKDEDQCVVCMDNKKCVLIYPCGHLCVCQKCAKKLDHCPVCRGKASDVVKVFQ